MTSSDLSSIVKPWEVTVEVTREIFTEFFMQVGLPSRPGSAVQYGPTPRTLIDRMCFFCVSGRATRSVRWATRPTR